jgi:hypothetical protein
VVRQPSDLRTISVAVRVSGTYVKRTSSLKLASQVRGRDVAQPMPGWGKAPGHGRLTAVWQMQCCQSPAMRAGRSAGLGLKDSS